MLGGMKSDFNIVFTALLLVCAVFSTIINLLYKTYIKFSEKIIGGYVVNNIEVLYGIIVFAIGLYSLHFEIRNDGLSKTFTNFYFLSIPLTYLILLIKVKKAVQN